MCMHCTCTHCTVQVNVSLSYVDKTMESLFAGLKQRGVEECVNIIIVSGHGMTTYNSSKLVNLTEVSGYMHVIIVMYYSGSVM